MVQFHGLIVSRGHYFATTVGQHTCASPKKLKQSQVATPSTHQKYTFCPPAAIVRLAHNTKSGQAYARRPWSARHVHNTLLSTL